MLTCFGHFPTLEILSRNKGIHVSATSFFHNFPQLVGDSRVGYQLNSLPANQHEMFERESYDLF